MAVPIKTSIKAAYLAAGVWAVITQCTFMMLLFASWPLTSLQKNSFSCQWNPGHCYLIKIHPNMVRMDLLQHCAIAPVLYNKPSLSPLTFLIFFFFFHLSVSPPIPTCHNVPLAHSWLDSLWFAVCKDLIHEGSLEFMGTLFLWHMRSWQSRIRQLP